MGRSILFSLAFLVPAFQASVVLADPPLVNLRIGTGGSTANPGETFPGPTAPFGMVQLGPDTKSNSSLRARLRFKQKSTSGYADWDDRVIGFSHTRYSGTGADEGGAFRVLPVTDSRMLESRGGALGLAHDHEKIELGYYGVTFPNDKLEVELTASMHCGFHRYKKSDPDATLSLLLDGASRLHGRNLDQESHLQVEAASRSIHGDTLNRGYFSKLGGGQRLYFYAEYSSGIARAEAWLPPHVGATLSLAPEAREVEFKLCISYVSAANARLNFEAEARMNGFDQVRSQTAQDWDRWISRARIQTSDPDLLIQFNTALYHSFLMPTQFTDVNGEYLGFDQRVHLSEGFVYRTAFSLWDTFRTVHPLYTLIAPEIQRDSILSLLEMGRINGVFPLWPSGSIDGGAMFGAPANFLFSEYYLKNGHDFDAHLVLRLMSSGASPDAPSAFPGRGRGCVKTGYCASDLVKGSVSETLEDAWADDANFQLARSVGDVAEAARAQGRSRAFEWLWDPESHFFRPKDSHGQFQSFTPHVPHNLAFLGRNMHAYSEMSVDQYRFSVPHAPARLIELYGGPEAFTAELDRFMNGASGRMGANLFETQYWQGNEPDLHALYLFNEAGHPELTQKWARWAIRTRYANSANGLDGNDDAGALSAWYVFTALGLYPQAGTDQYWIGSPAVDSAELDLGKGRKLSIRVHNQAQENVYLRKILVNGVRWCKPTLSHSDLMGGHIEFFMQSMPMPSGGYECNLRD